MQSALEFIATLASGLFAGAAIYINLVEHPANAAGYPERSRAMGAELRTSHFDAGAARRDWSPECSGGMVDWRGNSVARRGSVAGSGGAVHVSRDHAHQPATAESVPRPGLFRDSRAAGTLGKAPCRAQRVGANCIRALRVGKQMKTSALSLSIAVLAFGASTIYLAVQLSEERAHSEQLASASRAQCSRRRARKARDEGRFAMKDTFGGVSICHPARCRALSRLHYRPPRKGGLTTGDSRGEWAVHAAARRSIPENDASQMRSNNRRCMRRGRTTRAQQGGCWQTDRLAQRAAAREHELAREIHEPRRRPAADGNSFAVSNGRRSSTSSVADKARIVRKKTRIAYPLAEKSK